MKQTVTALQGSGGRVYLNPFNSAAAQLYVSGEQPVLLPNKANQIPIEGHSDWQTWLNNALQTHTQILHQENLIGE